MSVACRLHSCALTSGALRWHVLCSSPRKILLQEHAQLTTRHAGVFLAAGTDGGRRAGWRRRGGRVCRGAHGPARGCCRALLCGGGRSGACPHLRDCLSCSALLGLTLGPCPLIRSLGQRCLFAALLTTSTAPSAGPHPSHQAASALLKQNPAELASAAAAGNVPHTRPSRNSSKCPNASPSFVLLPQHVPSKVMQSRRPGLLSAPAWQLPTAASPLAHPALLGGAPPLRAPAPPPFPFIANRRAFHPRKLMKFAALGATAAAALPCPPPSTRFSAPALHSPDSCRRRRGVRPGPLPPSGAVPAPAL